MKNLLAIAILSILGFTSCNQVETVEPNTLSIDNQNNDYNGEYPDLDVSDGISECIKCVPSEEVEISGK